MIEPEILKRGDDSGNRMVVKYTTSSGGTVHAIGIPQSWDTPLGPTWCYVVEGDDLTVVDPGCHGSVQHLEEGLALIGYSLSAIGRIVVTHGHMDHDGNCLSVVEKSGAQLWAHEVYGSMLRADRWELEMGWRRQVVGFEAFENTDTVERVKEHQELAQRLTLDQPVTDGLASGGLTFFYTPGHSPDELCIQFGEIMFTGDHVLPLITPHPSVNRSYYSFRAALPESYRARNDIYGLKVMLTSLKRVAAMGDEISVLPAHRAFHRGTFHPIGLQRAQEIVDHHRDRCQDLIGLLKAGPKDMASLTRDHFSHRELEDSNYFAAFTEVMSHVELMMETGDVSIGHQSGDPQSGDGQSGAATAETWASTGLVRWNGTEEYSNFIDRLSPDSPR